MGPNGLCTWYFCDYFMTANKLNKLINKMVGCLRHILLHYITSTILETSLFQRQIRWIFFIFVDISSPVVKNRGCKRP